MIIDYGKQIGKYIQINGHNKINVLLETILFIQVKSYISDIHLTNGDIIIENYSLKDYEDLENLTGYGFFRVNNNVLVNCKHLTEIINNGNEKIAIVGDNMIKFSRNRLKEFRRLFLLN